MTTFAREFERSTVWPNGNFFIFLEVGLWCLTWIMQCTEPGCLPGHTCRQVIQKWNFLIFIFYCIDIRCERLRSSRAIALPIPPLPLRKNENFEDLTVVYLSSHSFFLAYEKNYHFSNHTEKDDSPPISFILVLIRFSNRTIDIARNSPSNTHNGRKWR